MSYTLNTPLVRALIATGATAAALHVVKPYTFFEENGEPRPWTQSVKRVDQLKRATSVPWWLATLAVGVAVDLFS